MTRDKIWSFVKCKHISLLLVHKARYMKKKFHVDFILCPNEIHLSLFNILCKTYLADTCFIPVSTVSQKWYSVRERGRCWWHIGLWSLGRWYLKGPNHFSSKLADQAENVRLKGAEKVSVILCNGLEKVSVILRNRLLRRLADTFSSPLRRLTDVFSAPFNLTF